MRILGGTLAILVAGSAAAAPVPLKDFARDDEFRAAEISPNGDYLAVSTVVEGQTALGIIDLKSRKVSGQMRFPRGNEVAGFDWVSPNRVVLSVAKSFGPLDQPALTGELYGIDADGSHRSYLFGYRGADHSSKQLGAKAEYATALLFNALIDDPLGALVTIYKWQTRGEADRGLHDLLIERLDVYNGRRTRVATLSGYEPIQATADRAGNLRFAVANDEDAQPRLYARANQGWKEIRHPGAAPDVVALHGATGDGSAVFLTSDEGGKRECLREYRTDTGALTERRCSETGAVGEPVFSLDRDALIGLLHEDGKPEFEWFDAKHPDALLRRSLIKAFGGQRVQITSRTSDGQQLVVLVNGDRNPGDFYLVERQSLKATYLLSRRAWIDPKAQVPSEAITYKTRDGATIHGFLTARDGLATRNAPLVLMPHGGPHGPRDFWGWDPWAQGLASRGYSVLQVNFRGSGGYGRAHETIGYRKWSTLMQDDLTDAVQWAIKQGIADARRVCIAGASYGGYASLMSPVREPDLYRCAIGLAGVYDLEALYDDTDVTESRFGRLYMQQFLGDAAQMREHSPITYIAKLKAPVLIAHGTDDKRAPFNQAKLLRKAMEANGKAYEWAEYKGEGHGFYKEDNFEDFLAKCLAFLDKHIGPATAAR
jgi:dipeptidyl aminopeptidase/acylaminoacyl peptidase